MVKQKHFTSSALRYSILFIVMWSLGAGVVFITLAKLLGNMVNREFLPFIIMAGYVALVLVLTLYFSHRLIGPFERLKMEMRLILGGDYSRRLHVRHRDDIYIKSFVEDVNKVIHELEMARGELEHLSHAAKSELKTLTSLVKGSPGCPNETSNAVIGCCEKVLAAVPEKKYDHGHPTHGVKR
ncbi:MAG: hypothetical protein M0018_02385 [Nitrospiraceae bacterium]|nr:hypothetical protein [Nitrospiraceae bacterium]